MARANWWWKTVAVSVFVLWAGSAFVLTTEQKIEKADDYTPDLEAEDFLNSNGDPWPVDNQFWPLVPGTTFIYEDPDGEEHNEVYVTDEEKIITLPSGDTITCVVVRDLEWEDDGEEDGIWTDDELLERTDDWYAQDDDGNVWYFGEYSESREDAESEWEAEGSWEAYVDGALPGILMLGSPKSGDAYRQEFYEDEAEDMAKVVNRKAEVSVPYGDYENCLKTKEWTPLEPGQVEHKYYAAGVGLVLVEELQGGKQRFELIDIQTP